MRNLKKVLAVVLALAMALSLAIPFATAAGTAPTSIESYTDGASIAAENREAVDVLTALGILNGFEDEAGKFSFQPQGNFTRAQAAKIVAYFDLGSKGAELLSIPSSDPFKDVASSHWAAKYIAYGAAAGYIDGVGDNNFNPEGQVTANQFVKMLLGVIGWGQKDEFIGPAWELNTIVSAETNGIYGRTDKATELSAAAKRETVARYAFRALINARLVTYVPGLGTYVDKNNGFISGKQANSTTQGEERFNLTVKRYAPQAAGVKFLPSTYKLYDRSYSLLNKLGFAGREWYAGTAKIAHWYPVDVLVAEVVLDGQTRSNMASAYTWDDTLVNVYDEDGKLVKTEPPQTEYWFNAYDMGLVATSLFASTSGAATYAAVSAPVSANGNVGDTLLLLDSGYEYKGVTTTNGTYTSGYTWIENDGDIDKVIQLQSYLAVAQRDSTDKVDATFGVYTDAKFDKDGYGKSGILTSASYTVSGEYKKGDFIVVTPTYTGKTGDDPFNFASLLDSYKATTPNGKYDKDYKNVNSSSSNNNKKKPTSVASGAERYYPVGAHFNLTTHAGADYAPWGQDVTFILDKNGYLFGVSSKVVPLNYLYIDYNPQYTFTQYDQTSGGTIARIHAYFTDGTEKMINLATMGAYITIPNINVYNDQTYKDGKMLASAMLYEYCTLPYLTYAGSIQGVATTSAEFAAKLQGHWFAYSTDAAGNYSLRVIPNNAFEVVPATVGVSAPGGPTRPEDQKGALQLGFTLNATSKVTSVYAYTPGVDYIAGKKWTMTSDTVLNLWGTIYTGYLTFPNSGNNITPHDGDDDVAADLSALAVNGYVPKDYKALATSKVNAAASAWGPATYLPEVSLIVAESRDSLYLKNIYVIDKISAATPAAVPAIVLDTNNEHTNSYEEYLVLTPNADGTITQDGILKKIYSNPYIFSTHNFEQHEAGCIIDVSSGADLTNVFAGVVIGTDNHGQIRVLAPAGGIGSTVLGSSAPAYIIYELHAPEGALLAEMDGQVAIYLDELKFGDMVNIYVTEADVGTTAAYSDYDVGGLLTAAVVYGNITDDFELVGIAGTNKAVLDYLVAQFKTANIGAFNDKTIAVGAIADGIEAILAKLDATINGDAVDAIVVRDTVSGVSAVLDRATTLKELADTSGNHMVSVRALNEDGDAATVTYNLSSFVGKDPTLDEWAATAFAANLYSSNYVAPLADDAAADPALILLTKSWPAGTKIYGAGMDSTYAAVPITIPANVDKAGYKSVADAEDLVAPGDYCIVVVNTFNYLLVVPK